jgi:hypothetical protein
VCEAPAVVCPRRHYEPLPTRLGPERSSAVDSRSECGPTLASCPPNGGPSALRTAIVTRPGDSDRWNRTARRDYTLVGTVLGRVSIRLASAAAGLLLVATACGNTSKATSESSNPDMNLCPQVVHATFPPDFPVYPGATLIEDGQCAGFSGTSRGMVQCGFACADPCRHVHQDTRSSRGATQVVNWSRRGGWGRS